MPVVLQTGKNPSRQLAVSLLELRPGSASVAHPANSTPPTVVPASVPYLYAPTAAPTGSERVVDSHLRGSLPGW